MKLVLILAFIFCFLDLKAQELYPSSEPASAMSAKSIGLRLNNLFFPAYDASAINNKNAFRLNPELMWGINKKWMVHVNFYSSNVHQNNLKFEGSSLYLKYRFYSDDKVQSHFRLAVYGKLAMINNPIQYHEINFIGDNSGFGSGIIVTQLLHKLALSFTGGYLHGIDNFSYQYPASMPNQSLNYSLSAGYLLLPHHYKTYKQTNMNFYLEFLGKMNLADKQNYLDIAPALQFIFGSIYRIDLVYQKQFYGNLLRANNTIFSFRFEYNLLNAYK